MNCQKMDLVWRSPVSKIRLQQMRELEVPKNPPLPLRNSDTTCSWVINSGSPAQRRRTEVLLPPAGIRKDGIWDQKTKCLGTYCWVSQQLEKSHTTHLMTEVFIRGGQSFAESDEPCNNHFPSLWLQRFSHFLVLKKATRRKNSQSRLGITGYCNYHPKFRLETGSTAVI